MPVSAAQQQLMRDMFKVKKKSEAGQSSSCAAPAGPETPDLKASGAQIRPFHGGWANALNVLDAASSSSTEGITHRDSQPSLLAEVTSSRGEQQQTAGGSSRDQAQQPIQGHGLAASSSHAGQGDAAAKSQKEEGLSLADRLQQRRLKWQQDLQHKLATERVSENAAPSSLPPLSQQQQQPQQQGDAEEEEEVQIIADHEKQQQGAASPSHHHTPSKRSPGILSSPSKRIAAADSRQQDRSRARRNLFDRDPDVIVISDSD